MSSHVVNSEAYWSGMSPRRFVGKTKVARWLLMAGAVFLCLLPIAGAQQSPGANARHDPDGNRNPIVQRGDNITSAQAATILAELHEIRRLLEKQQVQLDRAFVPSVLPERVQIGVANTWHALGSDEAPVTLVEFTDLQCAFCRRFHAETFPLLKKNYIDTGKVRFVSRDMPLEFHKYLSYAQSLERSGRS